jgi:hypothetical protein
MDTGTSVGDLIGIGKACNSISFKELDRLVKSGHHHHLMEYNFFSP